MPEKVRVSPAPSRQLSTGAVVQAALVPEDDEPLDDEPDPEEPEDPEEDEPDDEPDPFDDEPDPEDDSDFAGSELLPDDRLSVR